MLMISTDNLLLRDFQYADLPAYLQLREDAKFQRFYSEADSADEKAKYLLHRFIGWIAETPRTKFQLAVVLSAGELIGSCGIRIEAPGQASIGCELGRLWHGKGLAREAGRAIIKFGFQDLQLRRIYAETIAENKAAIKLCQSIGMRIESERVADQFFKGRSWNTTVLAITDSEWHKLNDG